MKILVIGSLNIDFTSYVENFPNNGETINSLEYKINFGGKGINQAIACFRAKADTTFFGAIGNDEYGKTYKEFLNKNKLNAVLLTKNTFTGNAQIIVNKKSENKIIINHGANYELSIEDISNYINEHQRDFDIVVIQNEIRNEVTEHIIKLCGEYNKVIIYNPAPTINIDDNLFKYITYFIPNEKEILFYSKNNDFESAVDTLLNKGIKNIIVTLGDKGSMFINKENKFFIDAYKVKAIDTVGAGDTFIGYFSAMLSQNKELSECMKIASLASSISVTKKGAISSIPYLEDLKLN